MERSEGSNDLKKSAPGRGRPPGVKEPQKRAGAGAERAPGAGRPTGIPESKKRASAGAERAPGAGRPTGIPESKKRASAGAERAPGAGRPTGIKELQKREGAGTERAPGAGRPPGMKDTKKRPAGGSNHQLPQTKSKKLVEDGWSMYAEEHFKEALALFEEATVVDPNNGRAFESVSKLTWKLRYILTDGNISNDEMQRCLSSAEESQRLGWEGAEYQVMFMRTMGPRGRGPILPEYLPGLLCFYEAQAGKLSTDLVARSEIYQLYGMVLWEAKQPELAMIADQKSAELNPDNFNAFHNRSFVLRSLGRYPEAVEDVQASLRLRPAFGPSRLLLEELQLACASSAVADSVLLVDADLYGDADLNDCEVDDATSPEHFDGLMGEVVDYEAEVLRLRARLTNLLHSGVIVEGKLATTQGRLGMQGLLQDDHSNNGCTVIAILIATVSLLGFTSGLIAEHIIDVFCRPLLASVRERVYPGLGYALVDPYEALGEVKRRGLIGFENTGETGGVMCQRWTGDIFSDAGLLNEFARSAFDAGSMGATFYFKEHSFAITKDKGIMRVIDSRVLDGESSCSKTWDIRDPSVLVDFLIAKCVSDLNSANIENLRADAGGSRPSIFSVEIYRFDIDPNAGRSNSVRSIMLSHWGAFALSEGIDLLKEPEDLHAMFVLKSTNHLSRWGEGHCAPVQAGCKAEVPSDEDNELDDREGFEYELMEAAQLRICACCGQERTGLLVPGVIYSQDDPIFRALHGDLVLVPGEPLRACTRCVDVLKTGNRPKWAVRFPSPDTRFTEMSPLEYRLVRPIVPIISVYRLPGGDGQFASTGGTVNFVNDSVKVVSRLPRPLDECGGVWVRGSQTTVAQIVVETEVEPDYLRSVLAECIRDKHRAFEGIEVSEANLAAIAASNLDSVILPPPPELTPEELLAEEQKEEVDRQSNYGPDARHVLIMDVPEDVSRESFLRDLFGDAKPNVPGEAEAQPGAPGMVTRDILQPPFAPEALVDELAMGRAIYMRVFPHHFTNGEGGFEQADEGLTENEFIECCAFWHTRQFQRDVEFCAFAYKRFMTRKVNAVCSIAGNRIDGGVGKSTLPLASETAQAMQSPAISIDRPAVLAAVQQVLHPDFSVSAVIKETASRLQGFGPSLPGTPMAMRFHRRRAIAIINSGAMACPYSYFLTYGSNDRFWPQIPEMVLQPDIRASKGGVARSIEVPTIVLQRRERRARLAELAALRLSGGAALAVEPSNSDDSVGGADPSAADAGERMVADELLSIGASTSPLGVSISGASTLSAVETTLDVNLDDSGWEDEAEEGPLSHSSPAGHFQRRRARINRRATSRERHDDSPLENEMRSPQRAESPSASNVGARVLNTSDGATVVVEPSTSDGPVVGADASTADAGRRMVSDELNIGASTLPPLGVCTADVSTLLPAAAPLDENLDDYSAWEDEAEVEPPSRRGPSEEPPAYSGQSGHTLRRQEPRSKLKTSRERYDDSLFQSEMRSPRAKKASSQSSPQGAESPLLPNVGVQGAESPSPPNVGVRILNPSDAARLKVSDLDVVLTERGCIDLSGTKVDKYFRLCRLCGFCLTAQTEAMGVEDVRSALKSLISSSPQHSELRLTGTKVELQKRLALALRPPLPEMLPQAQRDRMVAENPLLATVHYYDRERALWKWVLKGKRRPLDDIKSDLKRHDALQRGSFHTHVLVGSKKRPGYCNDERQPLHTICEEFATVATSVHGERIANFDEFGNEIDADQEAYLTAVEQGDESAALPASGAPPVMKYDAQHRPRVPYKQHPGHKRPPLKRSSHPAYKAHARANRSAYQFHRCQQVCYKHGNLICRFRYPRRLHFGKARLCYRGAGATGRAGKRVYVELPRDHAWLNATQVIIQTSWAGNVDIQRVVEAPGSISYVLAAAYYTTATTKPDNDVLTKRFKASVARLPPNSTAAQRLTKCAHILLNTLQIPTQMQWAVMLNYSMVENSDKCVDVVVVPPAMQPTIIDVGAFSDDNDDDECITLSKKRKLVECYMLRHLCTNPCPLLGEGEGTPPLEWPSLCFSVFASNFYLTQSKNKDTTYVMGNYVVSKHQTPVCLCPIPHITSDDTNEQSAYGTLFMWFPFKLESELYIIPGSSPPVKTTAVEVLRHVKLQGLLTPKAQQARQVEAMAESARAGFGDECTEGEHFSVDVDALPADADGEVVNYEDFADGAPLPAPAWASAAVATGAALDGANGDILMLQPAEYSHLRNFAAMSEKLAKEARAEALSVFDSGRRDGAGVVGMEGGADFGDASGFDSAISVKEAELEKTLAELSLEQKDAFDCDVHYMGVGSTAGQLLKVLAGAAGTGKSKYLKAIVLWMRLQYGSLCAEVVAQTNAAARLVDGHTIDSMFPTDVTKSGSKKQKAAIVAFRARFEHVRLLIHEEHSLTSSETLLHMNDCFKTAFPEHAKLPFAGKHVISIGDFFQLPPTAGSPPYKDASTAKGAAGRKFFKGVFKLFSELTTPNFRQRKDPTLNAMCTAARFCEVPSAELLDALNARFGPVATAAAATKADALWTASTWKVVDKLNGDCLQKARQEGKTIVNFWAKHFLLIKAHQGIRRKRLKVDVGRAADVGDVIDEDAADTIDSRGLTLAVRRALLLINPLVDSSTGKRKSRSEIPRGAKPPLLTVGCGVRVRLTEKITFYNGLIPGATGFPVGFRYSSDLHTFGPVLPGADFNEATNSSEQPQLPLVLVQFDAKYYTGESCLPDLPRVVPIYPTTFNIEYNGQTYVREQLPLEASSTVTVHQSQGTNAEEHVMCPPGAPGADFTRALFYVALSRCETLKDLYLIMYKATANMFIKHKRSVEEINAEYTRLRSLPKWRDVQLPE